MSIPNQHNAKKINRKLRKTVNNEKREDCSVHTCIPQVKMVKFQLSSLAKLTSPANLSSQNISENPINLL